MIILKNNDSKILGSVITDDIFTLSAEDRDIIDKKDIENYENKIKKLTSFIKVFKPNLDNISVDKKINNDTYYCDKIFHYGDSAVNIEFESAGIKKLVRIFNALVSCSNGRVVFIDEFDANLHDVYFSKLIEFLKDYATGQLCFTTHNLSPIEILEDNKHSLDFLSNDSRVTSWTKNGNKSAIKQYIYGLIDYSPFNVNSIDYISSLLEK
ncbi:MAG: ATP/GTP-binding protein [Bacilli bacterium]